MAIDPTVLADEQVQRQALAAQGAPTEFAPTMLVSIAGTIVCPVAVFKTGKLLIVLI